MVRLSWSCCLAEGGSARSILARMDSAVAVHSFNEKLVDVVGLYLDAADKAIVL